MSGAVSSIPHEDNRAPPAGVIGRQHAGGQPCEDKVGPLGERGTPTVCPPLGSVVHIFLQVRDNA